MATSTKIEPVAAKLRAAWPSWRDRPIEARLAVLRTWRDALEAQRESIVAALIEDTGRKRISESEFAGVLARIDYWQRHAPNLLSGTLNGQSETAPSVSFEQRLHPLGLVGIISPWNVPLLLSLIDAIPALLAGCAVLLKPSEVTPRFMTPLRDSVQMVPELAAVFELVAGDGEVGESIVDMVDAVCFTGSSRTGRKVGAHAASRLIPAFLELGGKDPLIVLEGADIGLAVRAALRGSVLNTGQACQSMERIYVHTDLFEPFVERLVAEAGQVRLNCEPDTPGHLGPFIDRRQADVVEAHLADALNKGATRHCGEIVRRTEAVWCRPIILTDVTHDMRVMREETFAPVMPVMSFGHTDEAVALANDSSYGLSAAVIGPQAEAIAIASRIHAGAVSINDCGLTTMVSDVEKDAFADSGLGASRMGHSGLLRFLRKQSLLIQSQGAAAPIDAFLDM